MSKLMQSNLVNEIGSSQCIFLPVVRFVTRQQFTIMCMHDAQKEMNIAQIKYPNVTAGLISEQSEHCMYFTESKAVIHHTLATDGTRAIVGTLFIRVQ